MTYSITGFGSNGNAASGTSLAVSTTYAAGDHAYVFTSRGGASTETITDGVNTYTQIGSNVTIASGDIIAIWECGSTAAGTVNVTQTLGTARAFRAIGVVRVTGVSTGASVGIGQAQTAPGTGADLVTSTVLTPASQPAMLLGISCDFSGSAVTAGTGFNNVGTFATADTANATLTRIEDKRLTSTSNVAATFTGTGGGGTDNFGTFAICIPETAAASDGTYLLLI